MGARRKFRRQAERRESDKIFASADHHLVGVMTKAEAYTYELEELRSKSKVQAHAIKLLKTELSIAYRKIEKLKEELEAKDMA